jgi:hypothetical protein
MPVKLPGPLSTTMAAARPRSGRAAIIGTSASAWPRPSIRLSPPAGDPSNSATEQFSVALSITRRREAKGRAGWVMEAGKSGMDGRSGRADFVHFRNIMLDQAFDAVLERGGRRGQPEQAPCILR